MSKAAAFLRRSAGVGDVRRELMLRPDAFALSRGGTGIDAVPPPESSDRLANDARPRWGRGLGHIFAELRFTWLGSCAAPSSPAADRVRSGRVPHEARRLPALWQDALDQLRLKKARANETLM